MRFYTQQHQYYCGIDLHARSIYLCIMDQSGKILLHRDMRASPDSFLKAVAPYREDLVFSVECMFTWLGSAGGRGPVRFTLASFRLSMSPHT